MPTAILKPCLRPGCSALVKSGYCDAHRRVDTYKHDPTSKHLYNTARWKRIRKAHLKQEPDCVECKKDGWQVEGTQVDHVVPHNGDREKFYNGKLQTLCDRHHAIKTRVEQRITPRVGG